MKHLLNKKFSNLNETLIKSEKNSDFIDINLTEILFISTQQKTQSDSQIYA